MRLISTIHQDINGGIKPRVVIIVLLVFALIGSGAWYFFFIFSRPVEEPVVNEEKIECHSDDKILCEYITSWEAPEQYRFTNRETSEGITKISIYEYDLSDTPKIHARIEGGNETITIGDTLYTNQSGFWTKQKLDNPATIPKNQPISKPSPEDAAPIEPHNYKRIAKEKCGELNCFKYKITDPENPGLTQFIWFDDQDYKLRQLRFESGGTVSDQVFEYIPVNISAPAPVQNGA